MSKSYVLIDSQSYYDVPYDFYYWNIIFSWNDLTDAICQLENVETFIKYKYQINCGYFTKQIENNDEYLQELKRIENGLYTDTYYMVEYDLKLKTYKKILEIKYRKNNNYDNKDKYMLFVDMIMESIDDNLFFEKLVKLQNGLYKKYEFNLSWNKLLKNTLLLNGNSIFNAEHELDVFKYINSLSLQDYEDYDCFASENDVKNIIKRFEEQFNMSSEEFINLRKIGKAPDTFEAMLWKTLLRTI